MVVMGYLRRVLMSETAQVELKSGRVQAPATRTAAPPAAGCSPPPRD